ncbi:MAG TPA: amino acid adenylation domain-containing protein, partial [Candidatus Deferrimicrobium sp.]|nr:amino acid adenylation domain-containing protein [Candidatus Deferrimicrobium sp.]
MNKDIEVLFRYNIAEDFWLQKVNDVVCNPIFGDKKNPEVPSMKTFGQLSFIFPGQLAETVKEITGGSDAKAFLVFITALNVLVYKYTGINDILISTTGFRDDSPEEVKDVLIFFRSGVNEEGIIRELLNTVLIDLKAALEHQQFEYESFFNRFCSQCAGDKEALTALGLVYNKFNRESRRGEELDLLFSIEKHDGGIDLFIKYNTGYYTPDQVAQLGRHYLNILASMLENLDRPVHTVEMLSPGDKEQLTAGFMGEEIAYRGEEETFLFYFEGRVEQTPQAPALVCETAALSYRELNERANRLARCLLKEVFLAADDLVSIVMERSEKMVESILAVWKCGAAYVPVDPSYPGDRIETIIKDSGAKLIISETGIIPPKLERTLAAVTKIIYLDKIEEIRLNEDNANLCIPVLGRDLAYVIYTSGSTGKPKGVMIEQRGMMNHLHAKIAGIQIDSNSVIAQNASHCFDISLWQFFAALLKGGRTVIYPNRAVLNPGAFIKQLGEHGVNILEVVPSYLSVMLDLIEDQKTGHKFSRLNYLLVTGESVKPGLVKRWFEKFPGIKMVNAYGPTEASDDITHFIMDRYPGAGIGSIPIGRTLRNFRIYIVDPRMKLCPPGVKGEICVSGIGVGRGYLNDVKKTTDAFSEDPFREERGVRMYRTGDIGRYLPDGNIEFFGRKDYQVK